MELDLQHGTALHLTGPESFSDRDRVGVLSDVLEIALRVDRVSETAFREQVPGGSGDQLDEMLTVNNHPLASELVVTDTDTDTDTAQSVTGGDPVSLQEWVERHAEELSRSAAWSSPSAGS